MKPVSRLATLALLFGGVFVHAQTGAQTPARTPDVQTPAGRVALIRIGGTINPATAGFIARSIREATEAAAQCLILQLDTPGGLLDSTKDIVQSFYSSEVPVVVYVGPSGANATSAGAFITLASDIAAMAPNTSIGAAHPVSVGGSSEKVDEVMKQKLENFTVSYIETIASKRGRNVEWAKSAVKDSANITAEKALELKVIEIIADDLPHLLARLDGRAVRDRVLRTAGATLSEIPMNLRERVFQMAWRPEVLMILMLMAVYGIIGEVSNPGGIIPGVIGVVSLILALYMSAALPINAAGMVLIALAIALFIAEAFTPAFGLLTGGGVISLFFGLLLMFDRADPLFRLSFSFIIPATVVTAAFFIVVVAAGLRAQSLPVKSGREALIGRTAPALAAVDAHGGKIFVEGEYWNAVSQTPIAQGETVEILSLDGLTLKVKPAPIKQPT
jgi:membrane-bound serine protease (ClpP class)